MTGADDPGADHRAAGAVLTVLTGPAGSGRSHALARLGEAARADGRTVVALRLAAGEHELPGHFTSRLVAELGRGQTRRWKDEPAAHAAALARMLRERPDVTVLIDDAQWLDEPSLAIMAGVVRELAGSAVRWVCAVRTPLRGRSGSGAAVLAGLRSAGLARVAPVRRMPAAGLDALIVDRLRAQPHRTLREAALRASRGRPGALHAVLDGYRQAGATRMVDRRAYLLDPGESAGPPADLDDGLALARAVAVLGPLGPAAAPLAARALGLDAATLDEGLAGLVDAGVLRAAPEGGWSFVVPATAADLRSGLGPFERRRLAQLAVSALWTDDARTADPYYLADQLVHAGGLVDPVRSASELVQAAASVALTDPRAVRWLAAAVAATRRAAPALTSTALTSTAPAAPAGLRGEALRRHASAACAQGDFAAALSSAQALLAEDDPELAVEAELVRLAALRGTRDLAAVERIATGPPGTAPVVARAAALCWLDRWEAAAVLLAQARPAWPRPAGAEDLERLLWTIRGRADQDRTGERPAERPGRERPGPVPAARDRDRAVVADRERNRNVAPDRAVTPDRERAAAQVRAYVLAGDVGAVGRVLDRHGLAAADLPGLDQALLAWRRGEWEDALDWAWLSVAADVVVATPFVGALVLRAAAEILLGQGRPVRAQTLLDSGVSEELPLRHLLALARADIEAALGRAADVTVDAALAWAGDHGVAYGTDELWLLHTELARERGDGAAVRRGAAETHRAARALGTELGGLHAILARVAVAGDPAAGQEAVRIARALDQPMVAARTLERVARWGGGPPGLLREAYDRYGELPALTHRARVRVHMRQFDLTIPDRAATVAENERLLGELVAEGLSNRELAAALHTSEKSVESRLTRLFSRTGYRSRVDLAAAMVSGEHLP